jgi:hypothetical protein
MLAILAAVGATTLTFKTIKSQAAQQRASEAEPFDPAIAMLSKHLREPHHLVSWRGRLEHGSKIELEDNYVSSFFHLAVTDAISLPARTPCR